MPARFQSRRTIFFAVTSVLLVAGVVFADYWSAFPVDLQPQFVGRNQCLTCHQDQADAFAGSHHDLAMDRASDSTVLGDFDDVTFEHHGVSSRLYRDGERFMIRTEGEDGTMQDFEIKYVFGVDPLQQYMVEFDRPDDLADGEVPRVQVLRISWDVEKKAWFYLSPPDVDEKLEPGDPLHWTGIAQRWQTMCADCHSTNLQRNFDDDTQRYHTTFTDIDVSCEACHGPGSLHTELANSRSLFWDRNHGYGLAALKGDDPEPQLQSCAPCHSRRGLLDGSFTAGDLFHDHYDLERLTEATYHADGQIKDEVYVFGSFIQSKMYHKGIRCTDCHDPHTLELKHPGNETCTSCHQHAAGKYDVPAHHHHPVGTEGAKCVNCHMPHTTYMAIDERRDHSLRVPRPDLSVKLGTPNACSSCHVEDQRKNLDTETNQSLGEYAQWLAAAQAGDQAVADAIAQTDQWCDQACEKWYGSERKTPNHFAEPTVALRRGEPGAAAELLKIAVADDTVAPAIARASAWDELSASPLTPLASPAALRAAGQVVEQTFQPPMVRAAAARALAYGSPQQIRAGLLPLLDDDSKLVRSAAAGTILASGLYPSLSGAEQVRVDHVADELREALMTANDRGGAHMGWAMICEGRGKFNDAIESYQKAIAVEPETTGPRTNLAQLLESLAERETGPRREKLLEQTQILRAQELPRLKRDAELAPDLAALQYRYGLALYLAGHADEAMKQLERAVEINPEVPVYQQARDALKQQLGVE